MRRAAGSDRGQRGRDRRGYGRVGAASTIGSASVYVQGGWATDGTPIVLTIRAGPQESRNIGFLDQVEGVKVRLAEGKPAEFSSSGITVKVDF